MIIGRLKDLLMGRDGKQILSLTLDCDFREEYDRLKDKEVKIDIRRFSKKRSITANAYAWVLIDKIAEKTGYKVDEVYRNAIREIGGITDVYGVREQAVDAFNELWCGDHLGRQTMIIPGSTKTGWVNVKAWKGSSDFDSVQMARFIDSLIQDAESLGIPTLNDRDVKKLVTKWGESDVEKPVTA